VHAVVIVDGELSWEARPDPVPGDTELLVAVRAAGVNAADLLQRRGFYPAPPGYPPDIPGMELAGEVVATGAKVTRFGVGDRVMAVIGGGAQAELALVDETVAMPVPAATSWEQAGGFAESFVTAHDALVTQCGISVGDRVVVTGASGGVGTAAVQVAAVAGGWTVGSTRHPEHHDLLIELGAREAVNAGEAPTRGPYDVVLELIGAPSLVALIDSLAIGARVVVIGVGGGSWVELDLHALMRQRARLSASTLRARPLVDKAIAARAVANHLVPLLESGRLRVPIAASFPMREAAAAYESFATPGKFGKEVLVTGAIANPGR
jgi:NADPH:quinone reductase-like Zn-dependent oxidoreductase